MQHPADHTTPDYPFQKICSDYLTWGNHEYVVIVDRYSNWPMVFKAENGAEGLVKRLRECFVTFGVPEELTSDGGPQFKAAKTQAFLTSWGVHHRVSSVANPHANCRAEVAVKTVKRMMMDNTAANGSLDVDKFQRAMLVYRNSIDPETRASPALVLFGRPIRDAIPIPMGRYCPHSTWVDTLAHRERALAKRHSREHEKWMEHTKSLPPLRVGDSVYVQNLVGNHPRRWERTGTIVEVRQFHQYVVKIDGSGRLTLRNRQHLRKFTAFNARAHDSIIESLSPAMHPNEPANPRTAPMTPEEQGTHRSGVQEAPTMTEEAAEDYHPPEGTVNDPGDISHPEPTENLPSPPAPIEASPTAATTKVARALARLRPHNAAGNRESPPAATARGLRHRRDQE